MVSHGEIARVDVLSRDIATLSGVRVGDSGDVVTSTYGSRISAEPNVYQSTWTDYTYTPKDPDDETRMIFAVADDSKIQSIRAGRLPEVGYVEGCA